MAVYKRDIVDINLETGNIHRTFLNHSIGMKDQKADHFGVRVFRDGEPVNLTGVSVQGVFMPPQGSPIAITSGNIVSENVAEVVLPQACYNYDGQFTLAIKLVDSTNEVTGTVRIIDGMVDNTHASGTVAPVAAIPTYQEVLSTYEQAIAAINKTVRFDATQSLTDTQKATARSNIGAVSTAEMNTALAAKVNVSDIENDLTGTTAGKVLDARQGKVLDDKVSDLKSAMSDVTSMDKYGVYFDMEGLTINEGQYIKSDGSIGTNVSFMYTDYIELPEGTASVTVNRDVYTPSGDKYTQTKMVWWYDAEKELLGTGASNITSGNLLTSYEPTTFTAKYIRVNLSANKVHNFVRLNYYPALRYIRHKNSSDTADTMTEPGIYWIGSAMTGLPVTNPGFLTVKKAPFSTTDIEQSFITRYDSFTRLCVNGTWRAWVRYLNSSDEYNEIGVVGKYSDTFPSSQEVKETDIILKANGTYRIVCLTNREGRWNVYGKGNTTNLKRIYPWETETYFTNDSTDRYLCIYNYESTADPINVIVYNAEAVIAKRQDVKRKYTVGKTANAFDYSSLTRCLFDLKDNNEPKIIEIWEGDYDLYDEYKELYDANLLPIYTGDNPSMDYFPYCVWVPENTHIIGKGIVRLQWMPDPAEDDITPTQCKTISPLNVAATATIENVEVYCKNGRYCLHNDGLGKVQFRGAIQRYINCRFYKYANDTDSVSGDDYGFLPTTGFGIDNCMHHVYENCVFVNYAEERAFYGHSRPSTMDNQSESPDITLINCVIDSEASGATPPCVKFGNTNSTKPHIRVMFNSCYIAGVVKCQLESSASANCKNGFDVQYLNCGNVTMKINDPDNQYPPKAYNTNLTLL